MQFSRAVSLDRLRVSGFTPACVRAHPAVLAFYQRLTNLSSAAASPLSASAAGVGQLDSDSSFIQATAAITGSKRPANKLGEPG